MMKRIIIALISLITIVYMAGCSASDSYFKIQFLDVGQGDSALIECDGHYMLIDGGDSFAGNKVYQVLEEKNVHHLDILAISHLHKDHIGGLTKALSYISVIDRTISNKTDDSSSTFVDLENQLNSIGTKITIPHEDEILKLGSAEVKIIYSSQTESNDSLVLLITYGSTRFLFTGDIEYSTQTYISQKIQDEYGGLFKIDLIKMPHHGSYEGSLYRFLRTFMPDYAVISVGKNNLYGHPDYRTLDLLNNPELKCRVFRTDTDGDIVVKSNRIEIAVEYGE